MYYTIITSNKIYKTFLQVVINLKTQIQKQESLNTIIFYIVLFIRITGTQYKYSLKQIS